MKRIEHYKKLLETERKELVARLGRIDKHYQEQRSADAPDRAIETENDEVVDSLAEHGGEVLNAVNTALSRIESGTFGVCVACGSAIDERRLDLIPYTATCSQCAE